MPIFPGKDASVTIMIWGSPWLIRLNANGNVSTYRLRSVLDSRDKDMAFSKFPLHATRACVLSISRTL